MGTWACSYKFYEAVWLPVTTHKATVGRLYADLV